MIFKRKISVNEYCKTRLDLLFSSQQTTLWLQLKQSWPDNAVVMASDSSYLKNIRAAHITVLSMAVIKKYGIDIALQMNRCIQDYLDNHDQEEINSLLPVYDKALSTIPQDGILGIAQFLAAVICHDNCSQDTIFALGGQLYGALESIRADFKQIKIVSEL